MARYLSADVQSKFVIQPFRIHPFCAPPSPSLVSDLSQLCEGKGFCVGDGRLKSEETHRHISSQTLVYTHIHNQAQPHPLGSGVMDSTGIW